MKPGTPTKASHEPCHIPIRMPTNRPNRMPSHHGNAQKLIDSAVQMPTTAATEPTDRSICPVMITNSMPMASTST